MGIPTLWQHLFHCTKERKSVDTDPCMTMVVKAGQFLSLAKMYAYGQTTLKTTLFHILQLWGG